MDARNGTTVWTLSWGPEECYHGDLASLAVANGLVFVGRCNGRVYALRASDGSRMWYFDTLDRTESFAPEPVSYVSLLQTSPVVADGLLFIKRAGFFDHEFHSFWTPPIFYALNATDGRKLWSFEFSSGLPPPPPMLTPPPMLFETPPTAVPTDLGGTSTLWGWSPDLGVPRSTPAAAEGLVVIAEDFTVFALNATSGRLVWSVNLETFAYVLTDQNSVHAPLVLDRGLVFVATNSGRVYAFSAKDGTWAWSFKTMGRH